MSKNPIAIVSSLIILLLSGCIEFEHQEVEWKYLAEDEVIVATLRYQGIYGGDGKNKEGKKAAKELTEQEVKQLASVMQGGRAFFFNNWISEFNRTTMQNSIEKMGDVPEELKSRLLNLMVEQGEVKNVGFYLDEKGRLCGAQTFRLRKMKDVSDLTNQLITQEALKHINKDIGSETPKSQSGSPQDTQAFSLSASSLLKRLERVKYEQMRISGITKIRGKYQIYLEDVRDGNRFWLKEGSSNRGFTIIEVKPEEGFARIQKNGQSAKVHLRSKEIVVDEADQNTDLEMFRLIANEIEAKRPFLTVNSRGIGFRVPIKEEDFEKMMKDNPIPKGMSVEHSNNFLALEVEQNGNSGGKLTKECFPGYVNNAIEHVRKEYGLREKSEVDKVLRAFMESGR